MELLIALNILTLLLLAALTIFTLTTRRKDAAAELSALFKRQSDELREGVQRQIAAGATEQFERFGYIQNSVQDTLRQSREEMNRQLRGVAEQLDARLSYLQSTSTQSLERVSMTLESRMAALQASNEKRLEQMQGVVDEKLQKTLEARLSQSFALVGKQLESVQQGLGEMKNLAQDAKSLKNALTNVKERGTYGEIRLEKLLEDVLAPGQYCINIEIADNKRVEFAIKLPGSGETPLLLPIDSKFPIEDYNRLLDASDKPAIDAARKALAQKVRVFAKDIYEKYIVPPITTDFALMFLPTEGLYAEVVRNAALFEELRDKYKVTPVGAATLSAFLASLQMGFKTLAIERRSQEVWDTLRSVKAEFTKFGDMLDKAHKQIQTADKTLEEIVGRRTRAINRTLRGVADLESSEYVGGLLEDESGA